MTVHVLQEFEKFLLLTVKKAGTLGFWNQKIQGSMIFFAELGIQVAFLMDLFLSYSK